MCSLCKPSPCFPENDNCHREAWAPSLSILHGKKRLEDLSGSEIYGLLNLHPNTGTVAIFKLSWLSGGAHCHPQLLAGKLKHCMRCASTLHCLCPLPRTVSKQEQQLSAQCHVLNPFQRPQWPQRPFWHLAQVLLKPLNSAFLPIQGNTDVRHNCHHSMFPAHLDVAMMKLKPITPKQTNERIKLQWLHN